MPFDYDDYANIPSTGIIPDDRLPADRFSFGYFFIYEKDLDILAGIRSLLEGSVGIELRDASGDLKATFTLDETYNIDMYVLGPNLVSYAWNWNSPSEKSEGLDADGNSLEVESQASEPPEPDSGGGQTDKTAIVSSRFYSLTFIIDLEPGDTIKIAHHNLSAGTVVTQANLSIATRLSDSSTPALVDERCGQQFRVVAGKVADSKAGTNKKETRVVRSRHLGSPVALDQTEGATGPDGLVYADKLSGVNLARAEASTLYLLGTNNGKLLLFRSINDGKDWQQIMSQPTKIKTLAAHLARGGRYVVYGIGSDKKAAYAILKHGAGGWTLSESGACQLTPSPSTTMAPSATPTELPVVKINALEDGEGGLLRLLSTDKDGALRVYTSRDGKTWQQAPTSQ